MIPQAQQILSLAAGEVRRLGRGAGELTVLRGRVWLTGCQGPGGDSDRVLAPGDSLSLADARGTVVEPWQPGEGAVLRWQPCVQRFFAGWRGAFFATLARRAASSASRAQGCISAGDSIASSGALK